MMIKIQSEHSDNLNSIEFDEQLQRAGKTKPTDGTTRELAVSFVTYLQECKPEALECQVEQYLKSRGHDILWTPPYCPAALIFSQLKISGTMAKITLVFKHIKASK